jgi:hypothetical protein
MNYQRAKNLSAKLNTPNYSNIGHIITSYSLSKKENELIDYAVKIMEYPELVVHSDGSIIFPKNKKYKGSDNVHINGILTIREPKLVCKYVKKHYKYRITGTMMSEDILEPYLDYCTYYTKEEYDQQYDNPDMNLDIEEEFVSEGYETKNIIMLENDLAKYERLIITQ